MVLVSSKWSRRDLSFCRGWEGGKGGGPSDGVAAEGGEVREEVGEKRNWWEAKGGKEMQPATTAVVFIEYQNEFTSEGGKLHGAVKEVMEATGMLSKSTVKIFDAYDTVGED